MSSWPTSSPDIAPATATADETSRLRDAFARFARIGCPEDPLYVAMARAVADRADWASLLSAAPRPQRQPTLWFAAVHDRLLELHDEGGAQPALAAWYPSLGGHRLPDRDLPGALDAFLSAEGEAIRERIATRTTQTNEVGRSAVLHAVLRRLAQRDGRARFALLDVGCSAGLNLGVDRWRYRYVDDATGREFAVVDGSACEDAPRIDCRVLAGRGREDFAALCARARTNPRLEPDVASREGIDPAPVSLDDPAAVRWLRACLWPHDAARRARFDAAVAVALRHRWPVRQVAPDRIAGAVTQWLATVPPDVQPVVFNSWVLAYFDPAALEAHVAVLRRAIEDAGLAWISAEPIERVRQWWPDVAAMEPPPAGAIATEDDMRAATVWTVAARGPDGRMASSLAARSHAHGRWLQWA